MDGPIYQPVVLPTTPAFRSIEVWSSDLAALPVAAETRSALLDEAERRRAAAFRFDIHRDWFIRRRWLLRRILGDRLGVDPSQLKFDAEPLGRPRIVAPEAVVGTRFSTSHARGLALVAIRPHADVGVDIAAIDPAVIPGAAPVFMSGAELTRWSPLADDASVRTFFRLWTRKEACLKAAGTGLARDPRTVDAWQCAVTAVPDPGRQWPAATWTAADLDLGPAWAGAIAVPTD